MELAAGAGALGRCGFGVNRFESNAANRAIVRPRRSQACASQAASDSLGLLMIRAVALCAASSLLALVYTGGAHGSCPRPNDQHGPRYEITVGAYQSRGVS